MPTTIFSPFTATPLQLTAHKSAQGFHRVLRLKQRYVVARALGLLLFAPVTTFALELGEASIKSGIGQSLLVEIPYRLAANERLTPACVGLVPASRSADGLPTYTRASRVFISPTHIEIFGDTRVLEPLIGLNVAVHCNTAPHFVRSYQLFVDPPARIPAILSNGTQVASARAQATIDAAVPAATRQPDTTPGIPNATATTAATSVSTASHALDTTRANPSQRARGHAGGDVTQGQTYRVVRGDTLSGIAARVADRPATILETADAIFAANPEAFTRGNRDLIAAGRSITIPNMTPATATVPALSAPEPVPTSATQLPPADDAASVVAAEAIQPLAAAVPAVEPSAVPIPTATPIDLAPQAPSQATTGSTSVWLTVLLALGVAVLLSAPLAFVRRRKQQAAAQAGANVQQSRPRRPVDPVAGIEVVEGRLAGTPSADAPASTGSPDVEPATDSGAVLPAGLNGLALTIGPTDTVDLDVGTPVDERNDGFADRAAAAPSDNAAVGDETIEENAATARMPDLDAAATVQQQSPQSKSDLSNAPINDDQMTLTIVELDILRQDYEAEHTLTQQASQALRDALADLKATKAARAAAAETPTMELPQQSRAETTDSAANSQTARVRMK